MKNNNSQRHCGDIAGDGEENDIEKQNFSISPKKTGRKLFFPLSKKYFQFKFKRERRDKSRNSTQRQKI